MLELPIPNGRGSEFKCNVFCKLDALPTKPYKVFELNLRTTSLTRILPRLGNPSHEMQNYFYILSDR